MRRRHCLGLAAATLLMPAARAEVIDLNDAINKAGRQRMLSLRTAKAYCALGLQAAVAAATEVQAQSVALFDRQLFELKAFAPRPEIRATYQRVDTAWSAYKTLLVGRRPDRALGGQVLEQATRLAALAHQGTGQLEKSLAHPVGRLVNIAGRQRLLGQRIAAYTLGAAWGVVDDNAVAEINKARVDFGSAQQLLRAAPENTAGLRTLLEQAQGEFAAFVAASNKLLSGAADAQLAAEVFNSSERILQVAEAVADHYARLPA